AAARPRAAVSLIACSTPTRTGVGSEGFPASAPTPRGLAWLGRPGVKESTMQACTAWGSALAGLAVSVGAFAQPAAQMSLRSCVAGSPPLQVPATAEQATLDAADRQHFDAAAQARYPLYQ